MAIIRKKESSEDIQKTRITDSLTKTFSKNSMNGVPLSDMKSLLTYNSQSATFDYRGNFANSINNDSSCEDVYPDVIKLSKTLLFTRAIEKISDGVAGLPWTIDSTNKESTDEDIEKTEILAKAIKHPNSEEHNTYKKFIKAIVKDLLIFNVATIERQPHTESIETAYRKKQQPFWIWAVNPQHIHLNPEWLPHQTGIKPRFFYINHLDRKNNLSTNKIPLYEKDLFLIQARTSSWELIPDSPVLTAYKQLNTWLKLSKGQDIVVENPIRNHLISLEEGSDDQLGAFRQYWDTHVLGRTAPPIIRGKINIQKIAAETDSELFLQYTEYLISLIALSFSLSKRDYNLTEHDNRATSEASADSSFQEAILPIAKTVVEHLNNEVVEYYTDSKFCLKLGELEARKQDVEATIVQTLYTSNIATKNEMRKRIGLEALEGADIFSIEEQQGQQEQEGQQEQQEQEGQQEQQEQEKQENLEVIPNEDNNSRNLIDSSQGQFSSEEQTIQEALDTINTEDEEQTIQGVLDTINTEDEEEQIKEINKILKKEGLLNIKAEEKLEQLSLF